MKYSVQHTNNNIYKVTITSSSEEEAKFLERQFSEIRDKLYEYFDNGIKEALGEGAKIEHYVDDSKLPYEVLSLVSNKSA